MIEEIIQQFELKAKRIHMKLLISEVDVMPSLKQVQRYLKYKRDLIGDNSNIDEIASYIEQLKYVPLQTADDELIVFGCEIGNGSDSNHFHLGFSSIKLVRQIETFPHCCFHIDATYKIVKYAFPLIVYGISDIKRQFFPLAFMFTSHEQVEDFNHFFKSFDDLCEKLNVIHKPQ